MAKQNRFDDLEEMLVPQDASAEQADDQHKPKKEPKPSKKNAGKTPRQLEREAQKRKEITKLVVIGVLVFVAMIGVLVAVGFAMGERAGIGKPGSVRKAEPDPTRSAFTNLSAMPEMSTEGVKGMLKEAYFTVDGDLALTFRLSNGTPVDHTLKTMNVLVFNDKGDTVAEQMFTTFKPQVLVPSNGFEDAYVIVDEENVLLPEDSLYSLGSTLDITSEAPNDKEETPVDPDDPKAIAPNRTYFDAPGNLPPLSAEGVKGTVILAQYTNDGSLAVTLSLSNGTAVDQQVTSVSLLIADGEGTTIAEQAFSTFDVPCTVLSNAYNQLKVIVDPQNVPVKDDSLATLSCTVNVSADPVPATTVASSAEATPTDAQTPAA